MRDWNPLLRRGTAWLAAALAFALANLGHLCNPGYFSHDELQWGWRAQQGLGHDWLDNSAFQYRPLTFQLWLWIGRWVFDTPAAYHALWVALGFGVCALLYGVLRRAGASPRIALFGTAAFALNPYAMYVHGWVATLSELIWTACALGIAWFALGPRDRAGSRHAPAAMRAAATRDEPSARAIAASTVTRDAPSARAIVVAAFALTAIALLAKETALAIAPLAALAWALTRDGRWRAALLGASVPTLAYLALRLPTLLFADRPDGAYAWSLAYLPQRWAEFQAWPLIPTVLEMTSLGLARPTRLALIAAFAALLIAAVIRTDRRLGTGLILGAAIALGPAIVLATGYPQYGYAASALAWACIACAWPTMRLPARAVLVAALAANVVHGVNIQREMLRVGGIEREFTASLQPVVQQAGAPLALVPRVPSDDWIYRRFSESLPYAQREVQIRTQGPGLSIDASGRIQQPPDDG